MPRSASHLGGAAVFDEGGGGTRLERLCERVAEGLAHKRLGVVDELHLLRDHRRRRVDEGLGGAVGEDAGGRELVAEELRELLLRQGAQVLAVDPSKLLHVEDRGRFRHPVERERLRVWGEGWRARVGRGGRRAAALTAGPSRSRVRHAGKGGRPGSSHGERVGRRGLPARAPGSSAPFRSQQSGPSRGGEGARHRDELVDGVNLLVRPVVPPQVAQVVDHRLR